ncbi:hypothetical protein [Wolbachia endosymbiont (group A) of Anomoia purmunda]|uniref:hypothetical protein n=1 Tax=Wolbachia endosymbiont (group A) of Anomoia purmunda TaxID=2953978 RepID=UPI00222E7F2B|nr:hypothetical protein [Wolbachia endosymbiont (group A) of Anomoia purmunda]
MTAIYFIPRFIRGISAANKQWDDELLNRHTAIHSTTVRTLQFEPTRRMSSQCPDTGIQET